MTTSSTVAVLLGLDGFAVCLALELLGLQTRRTIPLIGWFGLCDGLALFAGGVFHPSLPSIPGVLGGLMGACALVALLLMVFGARLLLPLPPVLLAVDNLLAGVTGRHTVALENVALSCVVSAALAGAGLLAGREFARHLRPEQAQLAGIGFLFAAGFSAMA